MVFPKQLSMDEAKLAIPIWLAALEDFTEDDVRQAAKLVLKQLNRFPTPADVRAAVQTIQLVRAIQAR